jgi:competence protein ComEC
MGTALKLTLFYPQTWHQQTWLMLTHLSQGDQRDLLQSAPALASDVLWWDGQRLQPDLVAAIQPRIAIASARNLDPAIADDLKQRGIQVWCTEQDGAILWQPRQGYHAYLATDGPPQTVWD